MKTKKLWIIATAFALIATFTLSPAFAYAKQGKGGGEENRVKKETAARWQSVEDDDDDDKEDKKKETEWRLLERRNNRGEKECLRAFGLLIARGHRMERLEELRDRVCFWPFGIWKKFVGGRASTTPPAPDTTAPVISGISTKPKVFRADVRWETNEKTRGVLYYGTTTPLNLAGAARISRSPNRIHEVELSGLLASTTYYALVNATDPAGNTATSSEFSFTTKSTVPDTVAPIISSVATLVGTTTISVRWQTNELSTSKLFFGTTTPLDASASTTPFIESAALVKTHRLDLGSLATSTTYYFIIESRDASGNLRRTGQFQAMTLGM